MGQLGAAMSNPNTGAPDPSGFNGSEWAARFMGAGAKGLGQGMQNMGQQQPQGGGAQMPIPMPQQPQVNLPGMQGAPNNNMRRNMFFGQ